MYIHSITTFSTSINRSVNFVRTAIRLGKIEATMVGCQWILPGSEVERFNDKPFQITRKEIEGNKEAT